MVGLFVINGSGLRFWFLFLLLKLFGFVFLRMLFIFILIKLVVFGFINIMVFVDVYGNIL